MRRGGVSGLSASQRQRVGCEALRSGLQDYRVSFVAGDDAVELFEVLGFVDGYTELFYFEGAGIADNVAIHHCLGVIAGEAVVGINRRRQVIDNVAGVYGDFKGIGIARRSLEFDGE